jgi:hypothetical protein
MSRSFRTLVERQIAKAMAEGQLSGLAGEGKPLPPRPGGGIGDLATEVAVRIVAEAGAVPEEIKLRKLLEAAKESWREAETPEEKRLAMALIADLEQRYNIAMEARRKFMRP